MNRISASDWRPADGMLLEDNAIAAIRALENTLVVAGPGSGKTELLAQKACYLLQTNTCLYPRRILAISFKRDAAFNIKERVTRRCGRELSQRFDSYTFDSFAKQILDRFRNGLVEPYTVSANYDLMADAKVANKEIDSTFRMLDQEFYHTTGDKSELLTRYRLPHEISDREMRIIRHAWLHLTEQVPSKVNFQMIMRLAEYIMGANPTLRSYLHQTYSHVFLDEFQDTTFLQYDLMTTCFVGSSVNYTAVGDDKQTIMGWAGAIPDIFRRYMSDSAARRLPLTTNFRSAPRLIRLQNYLVEHLLKKDDFAEPNPNWRGGDGEARMCFFDTQADEIAYLLKEIRHWLVDDQISPREICVLVKQTPPTYTQALIERLGANGIHARDESTLFDILCDEVVIYVMNFLGVIFSGKYGLQGDDVFKFLCVVNIAYDDTGLLKLKKRYIQYAEEQNRRFAGTSILEADLGKLIVDMLDFAGIPKIIAAYPKYQQGGWLKKTLNKFYVHLKDYYRLTSDVLRALEALAGKGSIPVMTAHKSKGLEYHTVIFIGLEDKAFWTYQQQTNSDNNLVFVALSRAKERVLFTFCAHRGVRQTADSIEFIHRLLRSSPDVTIVDS